MVKNIKIALIVSSIILIFSSIFMGWYFVVVSFIMMLFIYVVMGVDSIFQKILYIKKINNLKEDLLCLEQLEKDYNKNFFKSFAGFLIVILGIGILTFLLILLKRIIG